MEKFLILFITLVSFCGCTIYNTEIKNNSYAPVASMQILRNSPLIQTSENILFFNKNTIKEMDAIFKDYNPNEEFFKLKDDDMSKIYVKTKTIDSFIKNKDEIFNVPVYISFRYMQDLVNTADSSETFDFSENKTTVSKEAKNLQKETGRKEFFKEEIIKNLYLEGINITEDYEKAKYIMNITIVEDGVMDKSKVSVGYVYTKTSGIITLMVEFIDLKERETILKYYIKNRSLYKDLRILYFIPKIKSSDDLDFEY